MAQGRRNADSGSRSSNGTRITDPRFESIQKSSLYRRPSNKNTKVTLDKRFAPMLTDERFSSKAKVDRYGRKLRPTTTGKDGTKNAELSKLYRVEADDDDEDEETPELDGDEDVQAELSRVAKASGDKSYDPARDGGYAESSSSEEESEVDSDAEAAEDENQLAFPAADEDGREAVPEGEISRRLAAVNLDWDNIRAVDLLAVFNSYATEGGSSGKVENVTIYPSSFGKERMEREETEGPPKELFAGKERLQVDEDEENSSSGEDVSESDEDEDEDEKIRKSLLKTDDGEEVSSTKLRNYQLERLRYFYAVVTCSSPQVAKAIYDNVDGREYLTSANFFDLRFVPDEMDFSEDQPRDESSKVPHGYRPNEFVTAALQHSKVKLTWDAEDTQRKEFQQRAFSGSRKELEENELRAYLASDNSSSEDEGEGVEVIDSTLGAISTAAVPTQPASNLSKSELRRQQLRAKLGLGDAPMQAKNKDVPVGDMQVTFTAGLTTSDKKDSVFENEPEIEETTAERYIRKERERKARRKEKLKAERNGEKSVADSEAKEMEQKQQDEGFDDPFFTATAEEAAASAEQKRVEKKKQRRAQRLAEEKAAEAETAELERIMKSNSKGNTTEEKSHFSLAALEKAEKALRKQKLKKGKGRLSQSEKLALEAKAKDDFELDVSDKRFTAVYERPEFALDPSHPRFRKTEAMNMLLEESRQRRKRNMDEDGEDLGASQSKKGRR